MIVHKNVTISLREAPSLTREGFTVKRTDGLVYEASSKYGVSYATDTFTAVELAKRQIDSALG